MIYLVKINLERGKYFMKKNIILGIIITILVVCVAVEGFFLWKQSSDKKKEERKGDTEQVEQTPSPEPSKEPKKLPKDEVIDGENIKISKKMHCKTCFYF